MTYRIASSVQTGRRSEGCGLHMQWIPADSQREDSSENGSNSVNEVRGNNHRRDWGVGSLTIFGVRTRHPLETVLPRAHPGRDHRLVVRESCRIRERTIVFVPRTGVFEK